MKKHWTIFIIGIVTALMPFLGFPGAWKTFFITSFGLMTVVLISLIIMRERYAKTLALDKRKRLAARMVRSNASKKGERTT